MSLTNKQYHHGDLKVAILEHAAQTIAAEGLEALSLRAIARDLGVSHGAPNRHFKNKAQLLAVLATSGWQQITAATLQAIETAEPQDPSARLNAMGRGFLKWALEHPSLFQTITHPDVGRYADADLKAAQEAFRSEIKMAVEASQVAGRHADTDLLALMLYTNAVPFGAAMILSNPFLSDPLLAATPTGLDREQLINKVIDLVVPLDSSPTHLSQPSLSSGSH